MFQKLKNFRQIATRYERLARSYRVILHLLGTVIWLAYLLVHMKKIPCVQKMP
ncbi:MAG: transposase [Ectothiorhodospiraceae bacterium]|nr:transposase [Ectothiorhodospiraceae bacterium]